MLLSDYVEQTNDVRMEVEMNGDYLVRLLN
jgi:hypothetical protein